MIRKIISCGADGVARAALEAAQRAGLACSGKKADDRPGAGGPGVDDGPAEAHRRNVMDADATVVVTRGATDPRMDLILKFCRQAGKPAFHLDLSQTGGFAAARMLSDWVEKLGVETLHVAGTDIAHDPALAGLAKNLLEAFFYLSMMSEGPALAPPSPVFLDDEELPRTVPEAVRRLKKDIPLKDRTIIANMAASELPNLDGSLGEYIRNTFRLWSGNYALLDSCRWVSQKPGSAKKDAAAVIILELWKELKKTHTLRVVK